MTSMWKQVITLFENRWRKWRRVRPSKQNQYGYNSNLYEDKVLNNEHKEGIDQLTKGWDDSTIKPETYENRPRSLNSSTTAHERDRGSISQSGRFTIEILGLTKESWPHISLASMLCAQQNRNEDVLQTNTITPKYQIQQPITKYILPHLRKVDMVWAPKKEKKGTLELHWQSWREIIT